MTEAYLEDLAWVHHTAFGDLARQAAGVLRTELAAAGIAGGLVVDLGCGSGILAAELAAAGYDVLGVDPSEAMLRLAAAQAPGARFVRLSLTDADIPPCVAVTAVGEAFCYAGPALPALFGRIFRSLQPGGVLLFDVAGPGRLSSPLDVYEDAAGQWLIALRREEADGALTRRITLFRRIGAAYRRSDETHTLRLYDPAAVAADLATAGFAARRVSGWGTFAFTSGWTGFVAQRPATGSPASNETRAMRSDRAPPLR